MAALLRLEQPYWACESSCEMCQLTQLLCHACAQPTMLRRSLAYSAACAALQAKGHRRDEAAGPALALTLATGQGTSAQFQRPGPGGPQPVQALSVFVALCWQPGSEGQVRWQPFW